MSIPRKSYRNILIMLCKVASSINTANANCALYLVCKPAHMQKKFTQTRLQWFAKLSEWAVSQKPKIFRQERSPRFNNTSSYMYHRHCPDDSVFENKHIITVEGHSSCYIHYLCDLKQYCWSDFTNTLNNGYKIFIGLIAWIYYYSRPKSKPLYCIKN